MRFFVDQLGRSNMVYNISSRTCKLNRTIMNKRLLGKILTIVGWLMILSFISDIINHFIHPKPDTYNPEPFSAHWIGAMLAKLLIIVLAITAIHYGRIFRARQ